MPKYISDKVAKALALYRTSKNLSVKEICKDCEISISSLHKARRRLNIESRSKNHEKNYDINRVNNYIEEFRRQKSENNMDAKEHKISKKPRVNKKALTEAVQAFEEENNLTKENLTKHNIKSGRRSMTEKEKKELKLLLEKDDFP